MSLTRHQVMTIPYALFLLVSCCTPPILMAYSFGYVGLLSAVTLHPELWSLVSVILVGLILVTLTSLAGLVASPVYWCMKFYSASLAAAVAPVVVLIIWFVTAMFLVDI